MWWISLKLVLMIVLSLHCPESTYKCKLGTTVSHSARSPPPLWWRGTVLGKLFHPFFPSCSSPGAVGEKEIFYRSVTGKVFNGLNSCPFARCPPPPLSLHCLALFSLFRSLTYAQHSLLVDADHPPHTSQKPTRNGTKFGQLMWICEPFSKTLITSIRIMVLCHVSFACPPPLPSPLCFVLNVLNCAISGETFGIECLCEIGWVVTNYDKS